MQTFLIFELAITFLTSSLKIKKVMANSLHKTETPWYSKPERTLHRWN